MYNWAVFASCLRNWKVRVICLPFNVTVNVIEIFSYSLHLTKSITGCYNQIIPSNFAIAIIYQLKGLLSSGSVYNPASSRHSLICGEAQRMASRKKARGLPIRGQQILLPTVLSGMITAHSPITLVTYRNLFRILLQNNDTVT